MKIVLLPIFVLVMASLVTTLSNNNISQGTKYSKFDKHVDNMSMYEVKRYIIENGLQHEYDGYSVATIKEKIKARNKYFN